MMNLKLMGKFPLGWSGTTLVEGESRQPRKWQGAKIPIEIRQKNYVIKTATTRWEFVQALRLRYSVFCREYAGKKFPIGIDTDRYDDKADLLVILDTAGPKKTVVGTYRLICSEDRDDFYSASEFDIDPFLQKPGKKLELSRACIAKKYRNGAVMNLLWRGLGEYIKRSQADYLFGLSSITTTSDTEARQYTRFFNKEQVIHPELKLEPNEDFRFKNFWRELEETPERDQDLPPLLRSYIKAGAQIVGEPAIDRKFRCIDFLTILDISKMSQGYARRYLKESTH